MQQKSNFLQMVDILTELLVTISVRHLARKRLQALEALAQL